MTNSNLAYEQISSSRVRADQQSKAFALVREFPYRTARELALKTNPDVLSHEALHKRLPELAARGRISRHSSRICTVTGKKATTWA